MSWRFGGVKVTVGGAAPGADFGPINGRDAVVAATAPLAVTHPGGSPTVVNPGDNIVAKRDAAGTNGTLWFTKGLHSLSALVAPLAGQRWILESIAGYTRTVDDSAVLDGNNGALNALIMGTALNVTIRGGVFQRQGNASSADFAATINHNAGLSGGGWLLEDIVIQNNFNKAFNLGAPNCTARRVYCTNNGRYGPNVAAVTPGQEYTGIVIENCRWSFNNSRQLDTGHAAGGSKFVHCPGIIIRDNWAHDNFGFAIWPDFVGTAGGDIQCTGNVVEHNRRSGIHFEGVVGGGNKIFRNYIYNNGWDTEPIGPVAAQFTNCAQIRITNADSTLHSGIRSDVSRNFLDFDLPQDNTVGRHFLLWNHDPIVTDCKNWDVHDNQFWMRTTNDQRVGGHDNKDAAGSVNVWDGDNDFFDNEYHVASDTAKYWKWDTGAGIGVAKNYTEWQGFHPADNESLVLI
jgi:hypothetical protein